jgi:uncharacterized protein YlxW (UPF0749 family)
VEKLRGERESTGRDAAVLRVDLDSARADRERLTAEVDGLKEELAR